MSSKPDRILQVLVMRKFLDLSNYFIWANLLEQHTLLPVRPSSLPSKNSLYHQKKLQSGLMSSTASLLILPQHYGTIKASIQIHESTIPTVHKVWYKRHKRKITTKHWTNNVTNVKQYKQHLGYNPKVNPGNANMAAVARPHPNGSCDRVRLTASKKDTMVQSNLEDRK